MSFERFVGGYFDPFDFRGEPEPVPSIAPLIRACVWGFILGSIAMLVLDWVTNGLS